MHKIPSATQPGAGALDTPPGYWRCFFCGASFPQGQSHSCPYVTGGGGLVAGAPLPPRDPRGSGSGAEPSLARIADAAEAILALLRTYLEPKENAK